ncbi:beta-1,6-N-acetylglucosaminyltransferase [Priestia endophytica]|uniref:beta-1,6-N-acetylglucosaminyltransferase n=1 Tax=Priestia endophytica TaxID=135735 RepID=UPI003D2BB7B0
MRIAFLIVAHKNVEQVNMLLKQLLRYKNSYIFLNIDKKSGISDDEIIDDSRVKLYKPRFDVAWGGISQVEVTINLLKMALESDLDFDYFSLHSGQDLAIKPVKEFADFLSKNEGISYMHTGHGQYKEGLLPFPNTIRGGFERFQLNWPSNSRSKYGRMKTKLFKLIIVPLFHKGVIKGKAVLPIEFYKGSNWFTLHKSAVDYIITYLNQNKQYSKMFINSYCCDEIFFHTILFNSSLKDRIIREDYRYVDWESGPESPRTLRRDDIDKISRSGNYFARKFDILIDSDVIDEFKDI